MPFFSCIAPGGTKTIRHSATWTGASALQDNDDFCHVSSDAGDSQPWELLDGPSSSPPYGPATPTSSIPTTCAQELIDNSSWDSRTFSSGSYLLPTDQNGNWRTEFHPAVKNPRAAATALGEAFDGPVLRSRLALLTESASSSMSDGLNRAFEGQDVPAMHDKVMGLIPTIKLPSKAQMSRSMDSISDKAQSLVVRRRPGAFGDEDLSGDHLSFARHMGAKARRALVSSRICKDWQVLPMGATLAWHAKLDAALSRGFLAEKGNFTVAQLFSMTPVWSGDPAGRFWRLALDTGLAEVVVDSSGDELEEKRVCLAVAFELSEAFGCLWVQDVDREAVDEGGWLAVAP
jgi:hypothetical protein